jgi:hypothetical protein
MTQISIDFTSKRPPEVQARIDEGMDRCDEHAQVLWKRVVDGCILAVARRLPEFTCDDVLEELEKLPEAPDTHNLAALGPRMKEVSRTLGYMEATDRVKRSKRPLKHGNLMRVWESRIFRRPA